MSVDDIERHDHAHGAGHTHEHCGGHDGHSHAPTVNATNERVVLTGFLLTFSFMIAEVIGGVLSGSLALIADAGHMLTDAAALALAWAGFRIGRRASDSRRTFGYLRFEVLAGFINAITLFALTIWITYEAINRLFEPHEVLAGPMLIVAVIGLAVNIGVFLMLRQGDTDHVNIKGAMLHVLGDLLGSVAAIGAAIIIWLTGWSPIDPILSVLLSLLILRAAWALLRNAVHILMEGTPPDLDLAAIRDDLMQTVPGVADVAHLHVWSITSGYVAATLEVTLSEGADPQAVTDEVKAALTERYSVRHPTVEINWSGGGTTCSIGGEHAH